MDIADRLFLHCVHITWVLGIPILAQLDPVKLHFRTIRIGINEDLGDTHVGGLKYE